VSRSVTPARGCTTAFVSSSHGKVFFLPWLLRPEKRERGKPEQKADGPSGSRPGQRGSHASTRRGRATLSLVCPSTPACPLPCLARLPSPSPSHLKAEPSQAHHSHPTPPTRPPPHRERGAPIWNEIFSPGPGPSVVARFDIFLCRGEVREDLPRDRASWMRRAAPAGGGGRGG
jgi:hypothetical protein